MIDAYLVISLKRCQDSRLRTFMERYNKYPRKVPLHIIEGIDGLELTDIQSTLPRGTFGCLLSHIKAIKFAKENKFSSVLILEDDTRFFPNFEAALEEVMKDLPVNWDCLWLGGKNVKPSIPYTFNLDRLVASVGGYGFILRDRVYDYFIERLSRLDMPCDEHYAEAHSELSAFRTKKPYIFHNHVTSVRIKTNEAQPA